MMIEKGMNAIKYILLILFFQLIYVIINNRHMSNILDNVFYIDIFGKTELYRS